MNSLWENEKSVSKLKAQKLKRELGFTTTNPLLENERSVSKLKRQRDPFYDNPRITLIGKNRETSKDVYFHQKQIEMSSLLLGLSRSGKSNFMIDQILQIIETGDAGLCVIDPHGSLYYDLVKHVSVKFPHLAHKIILFNPSKQVDTGKFVGFNPIPKNFKKNDFSSNETTDYIFKTTFGSDEVSDFIFSVWNEDEREKPRTRTFLDNIFYIAVKFQLNIVQAYELLFNDEFRNHFVNKLHPEIPIEKLVIFDVNQFNGMSETRKNEYREAVQNRLKTFGFDETLTQVFCAQKTIDFEKAMEEGQIIFMNIEGSELRNFGRKKSKFLGIALITDIMRAARYRDPNDPYLKPFFVYLDEFGETPVEGIAEALSGHAKRKVYYTLATQELEKIKIKDTNDSYKLYHDVIGNCRNKFAFALSPLDIDTIIDSMPELITHDELLRYNPEIAYRQVIEEVPETQVIEQESEKQNQSTAREYKESKSLSFVVQVTENKSFTFSVAQTNSRTEAEELVEMVMESKETSSIEEIVSAAALIRAKSNRNTFTNEERQGMAHTIASTTRNTSSEANRKIIGNTVSQARSRINEKAETSILANLATTIDVHGTKEQNIDEVQKLIEDSYSQSEKDSEQHSNSIDLSHSEIEDEGLSENRGREKTRGTVYKSGNTVKHHNTYLVGQRSSSNDTYETGKSIKEASQKVTSNVKKYLESENFSKITGAVERQGVEQSHGGGSNTQAIQNESRNRSYADGSDVKIINPSDDYQHIQGTNRQESIGSGSSNTQQSGTTQHTNYGQTLSEETKKEENKTSSQQEAEEHGVNNVESHDETTTKTQKYSASKEKHKEQSTSDIKEQMTGQEHSNSHKNSFNRIQTKGSKTVDALNMKEGEQVSSSQESVSGNKQVQGNRAIQGFVQETGQSKQLSDQQTKQFSGVVRQGLQDIEQTHQQSVAENLSSQALEAMKQTEETESISKIMSRATEELSTTQNTESKKQAKQEVMSHLRQNQKGKKLSFLRQIAINQVQQSSEISSNIFQQSSTKDIIESFVFSTSKETAITRVTTTVKKVMPQEYMKLNPEYKSIEQVKHDLRNELVNNQQGHCIVKLFGEKAIRLKTPYVELKYSGDLESVVTDFEIRNVEFHPECYVSMSDTTYNDSHEQEQENFQTPSKQTKSLKKKPPATKPPSNNGSKEAEPQRKSRFTQA